MAEDWFMFLPSPIKNFVAESEKEHKKRKKHKKKKKCESPT
jgi:hypothetical protein